MFWWGLGLGCGALGVLAIWVWVSVVGLWVSWMFGCVLCFFPAFSGLVSFVYFLYAYGHLMLF